MTVHAQFGAPQKLQISLCLFSQTVYYLLKIKSRVGRSKFFMGANKIKRNETLILNFESFHEHYLQENTLAICLPTLERIMNKYRSSLNFYTTSKQTYTSISCILLNKKIDVNSIYKVIDVYLHLDVIQKFTLNGILFANIFKP